MSTVTIKLPKKEKDRLIRLAIQYGFSLEEFSRRVLEQLASEIPEESLEDYFNPKALKESFRRAITEYKQGNFYRTL